MAKRELASRQDVLSEKSCLWLFLFCCVYLSYHTTRTIQAECLSVTLLLSCVCLQEYVMAKRELASRQDVLSEKDVCLPTCRVSFCDFFWFFLSCVCVCVTCFSLTPCRST